MRFYSQYGQDKWLYENYFKNKENGVFLEIGADDGVDKSNTKFFEEYLKWGGICVEPSPNRFKLLKENRECICENVAISDTEGEVEFMDISGWGKALSGIVSKYHDEHKARIELELNNPKNNGYEMVRVKTKTLTDILETHSLTNIDFCTIDTEGGEIDIIKSIDFDKINIKLIIVENNYNDTSVQKLLLDNGYKLIKKLSIDDVYEKI
jgi:FkbM family methyltransferase